MIQLDFLQSILKQEDNLNSTEALVDWIEDRNRTVKVDVKKTTFDNLPGWSVDKQTGTIYHESGKFFTIEGVQIGVNDDVRVKQWSQPIINQPEIGYLGFLVKKFNGVLHFLIQAKIEPGNVNNVQLSPTIQATRSNYKRVHKGKSTAYLEYFKDRKGTVLIDQLQSEQGARFFRKRNRNIILEVKEDIEVLEDFMWVTLRQIKDLLKVDNLVNMDTRTVISGISYGEFSSDVMNLVKVFSKNHEVDYDKDVFCSYVINGVSLHSSAEVHSWLTELKSNYELNVKLIPLNQVKDWIFEKDRIYHKDHKYFEVLAVNVEIANREVARWSQPIIKPSCEGIVAFISKKINGVLHFLVQAKLEVGNLDIVELAPTVQCITGDYRKGKNEYEVPFLDYILNIKKDQIRYDVMLSEEGGRFYKNQNRNMIIEANDNFDLQVPSNYKWLTLNQLMQFMAYNNNVNIEARSLLSVLTF